MRVLGRSLRHQPDKLAALCGDVGDDSGVRCMRYLASREHGLSCRDACRVGRLRGRDLLGSRQLCRCDFASQLSVESSTASTETGKQVQASRLVDLGEDLPDDMDDQVQSGLLVRLEKCHQEGFIDCVREHVLALHNNSRRE